MGHSKSFLSLSGFIASALGIKRSGGRGVLSILKKVVKPKLFVSAFTSAQSQDRVIPPGEIAKPVIRPRTVALAVLALKAKDITALGAVGASFPLDEFNEFSSHIHTPNLWISRTRERRNNTSALKFRL